MCDEVVSGHVVVKEGGGKGEPAPRKVKGGREGVHVLRGRQAPSEQVPRVGVAGAMMQGDLCHHHGVRGVAGEDVVCVGGNGSGAEDVVDGGGSGGATASREVGGSGGGARRCQAESGPRAPRAEARGVPGAPVLLRSPKRTHMSGRTRTRRWFMSLTLDTHSEYERRGGR